MNIGKVALISFPWDDRSDSKVRPVLCLTEPIGEHRQIVVAYIGSRIPEDSLESDCIISRVMMTLHRPDLVLIRK